MGERERTRVVEESESVAHRRRTYPDPVGEAVVAAQVEAPGRDLVAVCLGIAATISPGFMLGSLYVEMGPDLGFGEATSGALVAAFFGASAVLSAPLGRWVDRRGPAFTLRVALVGSAVLQAAIGVLGRSALLIGLLALVAGTANALIPESLLDTPLTYEAMRAAGTGLGSAGFIVFDDRTDPVSVAAAVSHFLAVESCGQCEPCKRDGMALAEHLEQLRGSMLDEFGYSDLLSRLDTVEDGQRCNLASQQTAVVGSLLRLYAPNVRQHREAEAAAPGSLVSNPVAIAPIDNIVGGRLVLDASELTKQPDWSHDETWSGAVPAALLGDTPVHIEAPTSSRRWPEWESQFDDRHPLEVIDSSHEELDRLIHDAMGSGPDARMTAGQRLEHAVRLHVDVTRRILTFMARRHGGDQGEEIADATELKGVHVLELLDEVDAAGDDEARWRDAVREVGVALHDFGAKEDEMLELLRHTMDPQERAELGDALAEGIATSTVP